MSLFSAAVKSIVSLKLKLSLAEVEINGGLTVLEGRGHGGHSNKVPAGLAITCVSYLVKVLGNCSLIPHSDETRG